jgi:molybdenum cofactor synthesis domain-containing protein
MAPTEAPRVALLLIGNELLSGKVVDTNGPFTIRALRQIGAELCETRVVQDDVDGIADGITALRHKYDVVLTSGGVGPTHDDVTLEAVAVSFSDTMEVRDELMAVVRRVFGDDDEAVRVWSRMARVPSRCELVQDAQMRWPIHRLDNVYVLPGVPQAFERQLEGILPRFSGPKVYLRTLYVSHGEGRIAEPLTGVSLVFPDVAFGSYPVVDATGARTRLTIESRDRARLEEASAALIAAIGDPHITEVQDGDSVLR